MIRKIKKLNTLIVLKLPVCYFYAKQIIRKFGKLCSINRRNYSQLNVLFKP